MALKKFREIFAILFVFILAYIAITIYGYYNDPNPPNKYSWLVSLIIIIPFSIFYAYIENKHKKKKMNIKAKLETFLTENNSSIMYFNYIGKVFRYETFYIHIKYHNKRYEFWTETGKIYFGKQMIYDYSSDREKVEVVDLMIASIKKHLFDKEIIE